MGGDDGLEGGDGEDIDERREYLPMMVKLNISLTVKPFQEN